MTTPSVRNMTIALALLLASATALSQGGGRASPGRHGAAAGAQRLAYGAGYQARQRQAPEPPRQAASAAQRP